MTDMKKNFNFLYPENIKNDNEIKSRLKNLIIENEKIAKISNLLIKPEKINESKFNFENFELKKFENLVLDLCPQILIKVFKK